MTIVSLTQNKIPIQLLLVSYILQYSNNISCDSTCFTLSNVIISNYNTTIDQHRYIKVVGTHNTVNRVFHLVTFEALYNSQPCLVENGIISKYIFIDWC